MIPPFSQFEDLKLVTEFIDRSCCKHTIAGEPVRYETWTRTQRLGGGSFGEVYKETCAETRDLRAVKQIRKSLAIRWNEVGILAQLRSDPEHFVQLIGWFEDKYDIYLAMEYLPGDLGGLLKERDLCEDETKRVTKQILTGLETLHKKGICHRDLKPGNILIGKWAPLSVKIGDFGVSKHSDGSTEWRTTTGTTPFMAPEIQELSTSGEESSAYTTAVDIWSLGCLVYYMITKTLPFPETRNLIDFLRNQSPFPLRTAVARTVPDPAIEFIASLLQPLPANRAPASRALLHSWLLIEKRDETIWPDISSDASEPVYAPGTKQIGRIARDPTLAAKGKSAAVDKPGQKAQPRASTAPRRRVLQYLLVAAAASGNCDLLLQQLGEGARPMEDPSGYTPIYSAAKNGHLRIIKLLLEHGAHLGVEGTHGVSALHGAVRGRNLQIVQYLLDEGADISAREVSPAGWTALLHSADIGHLDIVRYLLDRGADILGKKLDNGRDALQLAAEKGHYEVVNLLLERGADISATENLGHMAHHIAAQFGATEVLKLLLDRGADISARESSPAGWTALLLAVHFGHLDIVRYLLDRGADISEKKLHNGYDALQLAAEKRHYEVVNLLLERGADISATENLGHMAHHIAAQFGATEVLKLLLNRGADISARESSPAGWTALLLAVHFGHLDIVRYLLDRGADISEKKLHNGYDALQLAAEKGHYEVVNLLLERGADISATEDLGRMAHHIAAQFGVTEVLKLLLDRGADISARKASPAGWTALLIAAIYGHLDIVRYLLDRGADISEKALDDGHDALQLAAEKGRYEVVNLLLERGADISATENLGHMAHHIAAQFGATEVLKLLLNRGADISARESSPAGWTALLLAVHFGHLDIVRYLLDRGADMSEKRLDNGWDALQLAAEKGHGDIVRLLLARGATMTSTTSNGQTAISLAALQGHTGIVIQLSEWLEKDMTTPFTEMDILKLSLQDSTQTTSEDGSTTLWDSRA